MALAMKKQVFVANFCVLFALLQTAQAGAASITEPLPYPQSLLAGQPVSGEPIAAAITFDNTSYSLEKTPIRTLTRDLRVPLQREGTGDFTRDWTCLRSQGQYIWLIASASPMVTEVQMAESASVPSKRGVCYKLRDDFAPVSIGGVRPGMSRDEVRKRFGNPAYSGEDGWFFWSTAKTIEEYSNSRVQMNWTGIQLKNNRVSRIFSSQVTNP